MNTTRRTGNKNFHYGCLLLIIISFFPLVADEGKIVIAHRGASGYLPEHTLAAKALAYGMGADYLEQDVVMTKDDQLIVLHDIYLDTMTDVAEKFPGRVRENGRYYAVDFTLEEIRQLSLGERKSPQSGKVVYEKRFPGNIAIFSIPTLAEEIEMIQGLNVSSGKNVGIYVEMKKPAWHLKEGKDITLAVWEMLKKYGYESPDARVWLQCFEPAPLKRLRKELGCQLPLLQLIDMILPPETTIDYRRMVSAEGLDEIASYANGIGPDARYIVTGLTEAGQPIISSLLAEAHARSLVVHPYTFRREGLPPQIPDLETVLKLFYFQIGVDGLFTDFPDQAAAVLGR